MSEETTKSERKCRCGYSLIGKTLGVIAVVLLILGGYIYRQGSIRLGSFSLDLENGVLSEAAATEKIKNYINNDLLKGEATVEIVNLKKDKGVYSFTVKIGEEETPSYATVDGTLLFPQGYEITTPAASEESTETQTITKSDQPTAYLFTMSFCPYGNQAETGIKPVVDLLKDSVTIEPHYVIYSNYGGGGKDYCLDDEAKYCSMHGIQELNQDVRELCVYKYQPDKYWSFVEKINAQCSATDVDTCWEAQAKEAGITTSQIKTCQADEALDLLAQEVALTEQYGVSGSPALIINGGEYQGNRTAEAYKTGICSAFNTAPTACQETLSDESTASGEASCE